MLQPCGQIHYVLHLYTILKFKTLLNFLGINVQLKIDFPDFLIKKSKKVRKESYSIYYLN